MRSLQSRLGLGLTATLTVVMLALLQGSLWLLDSGLRRYHESNLQDEAETLLIALVRGEEGVQLDERRLHPAYQRTFSGRYFRIDFAEDVWRSRSLWDSELPRPPRKGLAPGLEDGIEGQRLLVYRGDFRRFGQNFSISVAQDYSPVLASLARIRWLGLGLGAGGLLLALLLQWLTVRRALAPLERVRAQIAELQAGRLGALDSDVPRELEPLVGQVNHLLHHTEETLKRSRHALGNLGHALKTPLAVLVSLANREELRAQPELRATLREQLEQIEQRLARELGRARLAGEALPGAHFDCATELPALCATLRQIHPHVDIDWQAPEGLRLPWDREDLLEALGNLLDNACKWADSAVRVSAGADGEGYWLCVEDDGPGIAPEQRETVVARGNRLDEQVAGHGLGLAIVRDIAQACGGSLSLEDSAELGGLCARLRLPRRALA
ncbi:sensor histidine kinase [Pseudomonas sp. AN-1]|uniref:ATP-binding protein n=1 Tax=Pseudomonas sp. AN-1 TaxID=3096605 RepID=UPI002A6B461D|nr:sensor histidine kinase [Pseudomonas sp. AN-1]WPP46702.1 sensor histidine kinase [Pseudomonas sp. AN-1]